METDDSAPGKAGRTEESRGEDAGEIKCPTILQSFDSDSAAREKEAGREEDDEEEDEGRRLKGRLSPMVMATSLCFLNRWYLRLSPLVFKL
jgi:hypothetical protein